MWINKNHKPFNNYHIYKIVTTWTSTKKLKNSIFQYYQMYHKHASTSTLYVGFWMLPDPNKTCTYFLSIDSICWLSIWIQSPMDIRRILSIKSVPKEDNLFSIFKYPNSKYLFFTLYTNFIGRLLKAGMCFFIYMQSPIHPLHATQSTFSE